MRCVAALSLLFAVVSQVTSKAVETKPPGLELTPLQQQCVNELNLHDQKDSIVNINSRAMCPEDNPTFNKFISCFWKKTGRQGADGQINYDTLKSFVREGMIQALGSEATVVNFAEDHSGKIIENCKSIDEKNEEKKVVKVRNCIVQGLEAVGHN